ncbi:Mannonate dehydratase [[Clostridium] cellulosi]|uniref:Mannonate dehydratase n=1 Tax=[Clostridium] cellulosi TaxID=29343 RepID=A0A078KL55_9FIRM|nr:Mannonate dehydratase [[Clostridium] cellulosi]
MIMSFRWFGEKGDSVTLNQIRQIPGVKNVVGALYDVPVGDPWPMDKILRLKRQVNDNGLALEVIESVNIHEDIKLGAPTRDMYIENYRESIRNLAKAGVKVICYNFMPVFDWVRTELFRPLGDGSTAMAYNHELLRNMSPNDLVAYVENNSNGFELPGWEKDRLSELKTVFEQYSDIDDEKLFENYKYFLEGIIPVCEEVGVRMAVHPDDPPRSLFGLPRIVINKKNLDRIVRMVDSPCNGITFCTGSLGANRENDLPEMIRYFGGMGKIPFAHVRNIKFLDGESYHESSHLSSDGSLDLYEIMKAFYDIHFDGYLRPDHGRTIWGEKARPGYGLYDRALGVTYLNGLWEALSKSNSAV